MMEIGAVLFVFPLVAIILFVVTNIIDNIAATLTVSMSMDRFDFDMYPWDGNYVPVSCNTYAEYGRIDIPISVLKRYLGPEYKEYTDGNHFLFEFEGDSPRRYIVAHLFDLVDRGDMYLRTCGKSIPAEHEWTPLERFLLKRAGAFFSR